MANTPSVLSTGLVVADTYEVERLLGRGGMGEVWRAKHRRLAGKSVALKVLHTSGQPPSADVLARFRREAEIAARLEHPNIVQVLDFNSLPTGEPFVVMELLKGESLASRLRRGPVPVDELRSIVRQVGSALLAAHSAGVVHRDLKPDNIFLVPTALGDQVKVLDFGISKLSDSSTVQTTDSVLIGTPLYMSPEQALGHNREVTPQSDLFSLGSICYELLSGKAPFAAENIAKVVFRIAYEAHVPLAEAAPGVPPDVARGIEHSLLKDREKRTPDIACFVHEVTGQTLGPQQQGSVRDSAGGIYSPEVAVSQSLAEGATVTPSTGRVAKPAEAAPASGAPTAPKPTPPEAPERQPETPPLSAASVAREPESSVARRALPPDPSPAVASEGPTTPEHRRARRRRPLLRAALIVLFAVWVGRSWLRTRHSDADDKEPAKHGLDLSIHVSTRPDAPKEEADAGVVKVGFAEAPGPSADVDSGPALAEVRPVLPPPGPKPKAPALEAPSAEEAAALEHLDSLFRSKKWDELYESMRGRQAVIVTAAGRRKLSENLLLSACHRRDLNAVNAQLNRLEAMGEGVVRAAKTACRSAWPEVGL